MCAWHIENTCKKEGVGMVNPLGSNRHWQWQKLGKDIPVGAACAKSFYMEAWKRGVSASIYLKLRVQCQGIWRLKRKPRYSKGLRFILKAWGPTEVFIIITFTFQDKHCIHQGVGWWFEPRETRGSILRCGECFMIKSEMWRIMSVAKFIHQTKYKGVFNRNIYRSNIHS